MVEYVVTGHGIGQQFPYVVATSKAQQAAMVDMLLNPPSDDLHYGAYFFLGDIPAYDDDAQGSITDAWLRVGVCRGYGGAYFYYQGERKGEDWSWVAIAPESTPDAPTVYFDQATKTVFPPQSVMPVKQLRELVLEYTDGGRPPSSVQWMAVNGLVWQLTEDGKVKPQ